MLGGYLPLVFHQQFGRVREKGILPQRSQGIVPRGAAAGGAVAEVLREGGTRHGGLVG